MVAKSEDEDVHFHDALALAVVFDGQVKRCRNPDRYQFFRRLFFVSHEITLSYLTIRCKDYFELFLVAHS